MNAQNMRFAFWAIGSTVDATSGVNVQHDSTEINTDERQSAFTSGTLNPPMSFTLEDSKQSPGTGRNFIRTVNGAVPNVTTVTASQSEKVTVDVDYIGQTLTPSSGTTTTITQDNITPYLWSSATLTLAGSSISTAKEIALEINQNVQAPHYLNGSRDISVPFPQNREYTLNVTLDWDGADADFIYNDLYKANNSFNAVLDFNQDSSTGSQHTIFIMSGCKLIKPEIPSTNEGPTEATIEVMPQNSTAQEFTSSASSFKFNPY